MLIWYKCYYKFPDEALDRVFIETKVNTFWHDFSSIMSKLLELLFSLDPQICLLGDFTNVSTLLRKSPQKFLEFAKKCKTITWKSDSQLPIFRLISEMNSCVPLENITYTCLSLLFFLLFCVRGFGGVFCSCFTKWKIRK